MMGKWNIPIRENLSLIPELPPNYWRIETIGAMCFSAGVPIESEWVSRGICMKLEGCRGRRSFRSHRDRYASCCESRLQLLSLQYVRRNDWGCLGSSGSRLRPSPLGESSRAAGHLCAGIWMRIQRPSISAMTLYGVIRIDGYGDWLPICYATVTLYLRLTRLRPVATLSSGISRLVGPQQTPSDSQSSPAGVELYIIRLIPPVNPVFTFLSSSRTVIFSISRPSLYCRVSGCIRLILMSGRFPHMIFTTVATVSQAKMKTFSKSAPPLSRLMPNVTMIRDPCPFFATMSTYWANLRRRRFAGTTAPYSHFISRADLFSPNREICTPKTFLNRTMAVCVQGVLNFLRVSQWEGVRGRVRDVAHLNFNRDDIHIVDYERISGMTHRSFAPVCHRSFLCGSARF